MTHPATVLCLSRAAVGARLASAAGTLQGAAYRVLPADARVCVRFRRHMQGPLQRLRLRVHQPRYRPTLCTVCPVPEAKACGCADTAAAELVSCFSHKAVLDTDPSMSAFNQDGSILAQVGGLRALVAVGRTVAAQASGNAETGQFQLLIVDSASGVVTLNSPLPGLREALGVSSDAPFVDVWGITVMAQ